MVFINGDLYTVEKLSRNHPDWNGVTDAIHRRTKSGQASITVEEIYEVLWRRKPFPWSWTHQFRPNRRFFYHGTTITIIQRILDEGFKVGDATTASHGRMLGNGVYATYHTHKGKMYAPDGYMLTVMVYAPNTLCIGPGQALDATTIANAPKLYDALEVRTNALVPNWAMHNHEICVFDTRRVIPKYILKVS